MSFPGSKACLYATLFFLAVAASHAQEYRATLLGTITDPTGAAIAGAKVIATNTETAVGVPTESAAEGSYLIPSLQPGTYRLRVETTGFKTFERGPFQLRLNERVRMDVTLEVGALTESVTVSSAPPLLETETALSGGVLEGTNLIQLPVEGKKAYQIMYYLPGLATVGYNSFSSLGQGDRAFGYSLDGISAKEPVRGVVTDQAKALQPSTDSLAEVKMATTGMPAEYGHSASGMLTTVMKSGTNQLHGSAEDRFMLKQMIHRQYFDLLPQPSPFYIHLLSGTVGGPVYIPKVYNGKNRTFFFAGFQLNDTRNSLTGIADVPSNEMLNGDFSFGGKGNPIYDPLSTRQDATGKWVRDQFPGNQLPKSRFNPVSTAFLGNNPWRAPNSAGYVDALGAHQNIVQNVLAQVTRPYFDAKIDHQFSPANRISGRYSGNYLRGWNRTDTPVLWDLVSSSMTGQPIINMANAAISDVYSINPTTINEFRVGYNGRFSTLLPASVGQGWAQKLGIPNVGAQSMPEFRTAGGSLYYLAGMGQMFREVGEDITLQENFTKSLRKHTIKAGYELVRSRFNSIAGGLPSGQYYMGGTDFPYTPNTGNDFAAFLLGSVTQATFTMPQATWLPRWWSHSFYVQDDFKLSRSISVNVGLRWSYESPFQTKYGQQSQFDPSATDPITGLRGAIVHPKGALAKRDLNNFQPRLGLAWNFSPKLVFRGSFALITVDLLSDVKDQNLEEYLATATVQQPTGDPRIAFLLSQGPPKIAFKVNPDGSVPFVGTNYSSRNASWYDSNMRNPYVMNWSGGFQWQFAPTWLAELNYQGSAGVGLRGTVDANTLPLSIYRSTDITYLNQVYSATQNYKPYPQFGSVTYTSNMGHNTYHRLLTRVEKRYSNGLTAQASFDLSKSMSGTGGTGWSYYNWNLTKARSNLDLNQRLLVVVTYELPFGKGRKFMNGGGFKDLLLGGWDIMGDQMAQSGRPMTVSYSGSPSRYLPGTARPNQILPNDQAQVQGWSIGPNRFPATAQNAYLNIAAFQYPAAYTPGTLGGNTFTGPKLVWAQISLSKSFRIRERVKIMVRWDMHNPYKYNSFTLGNPAFNLQTASSFARNFGTFDNYGSIGGRLHSYAVLRMEF